MTTHSTDALARIADMVQIMSQAAERVEGLKQQLEAAKNDHRRIEQEDLPDLMREFGVTDIKLQDGTSVKVTDEVDCAITEERRPAAHAWLINNGFGGLIKTDLTLSFGKDEREEADRVAAELTEITEAAPVVQERVHPATLKSFIKERMEAGQVVPFDLFGVHPFSKARIVAARKKK
jgi:hypothetical protein